MGTNYYRLPKDLIEIRQKLKDAIDNASDLQLTNSLSNRGSSLFEDIVNYDWKDEEGNNVLVHLGKRSGGWKFLWNFHRMKFYHDKETLLNFIREGRVFNEYGEEIDSEEFIDMALNWCPDGHDSFNPAPCYDFKTGELLPPQPRFSFPHDTYIDGLRISTPQETSTFFS